MNITGTQTRTARLGSGPNVATKALRCWQKTIARFGSSDFRGVGIALVRRRIGRARYIPIRHALLITVRCDPDPHPAFPHGVRLSAYAFRPVDCGVALGPHEDIDGADDGPLFEYDLTRGPGSDYRPKESGHVPGGRHEAVLEAGLRLLNRLAGGNRRLREETRLPRLFVGLPADAPPPTPGGPEVERVAQAARITETAALASAAVRSGGRLLYPYEYVADAAGGRLLVDAASVPAGQFVVDDDRLRGYRGNLAFDLRCRTRTAESIAPSRVRARGGRPVATLTAA